MEAMEDHERTPDSGEVPEQDRDVLLRFRLDSVINELSGQFYQRIFVIESMVLAALAGEHVLLLGPPGTAKSELTRAFAARLEGAESFDWLLSKFTQPEEVFGPVSIAGLKSDSFRRVTTGKMPRAHVAFLDEIFKANSAILNSLLTLVNERVYHNGTRVEQCPLRLCVGASNELPFDDSLAAFYDRFLVRHWVEPIMGAGDWTALVTRPRDATFGTTRVTLDEWDEACEQARAVHVPGALAQVAFKLKKVLEADGIEVSDRRWVKAFKLARAAAWLDGAPEVFADHCAVWEHVLWNEPEQRDAVRKAVTAMTAAEVQKAREIYDALTKKLDEIEPLEGDEFERKAAAINTDGRRALKDVSDLWMKARSPAAKERIKSMGSELKGRVKAVRGRLMSLGEVKTHGF